MASFGSLSGILVANVKSRASSARVVPASGSRPGLRPSLRSCRTDGGAFTPTWTSQPTLSRYHRRGSYRWRPYASRVSFLSRVFRCLATPRRLGGGGKDLNWRTPCGFSHLNFGNSFCRSCADLPIADPSSAPRSGFPHSRPPSPSPKYLARASKRIHLSRPASSTLLHAHAGSGSQIKE